LIFIFSYVTKKN